MRAILRGLVREGRHVAAETLHVERRLMPLSNGFREGKGKEGGVGTELQDCSPEVANDVLIQLNIDPEEVAEHVEVWCYPKIALTESNEIFDTKNPVGRDVVKLTPQKIEKATHKRMKWEAEPPPEVP